MAIDKEKGLSFVQKLVIKGQYKKAIAEYTKLIEEDPKDTRNYLKLGDLYFKIGDHEKAIAEYMKLAGLYEGEDLNSRAISIYKKILAINPKHLDALHRIASLYRKEGLAGDAKNYYQSILELKPDDQEAQKGLMDIDVYSQPPEFQKSDFKVIPAASSGSSTSDHLKPQDDKSDLFPSSVVQSKTPSVTIEVPSQPDKDSEMHYHLGIAYLEMNLYNYAISEFEKAALNPSIKFDCYIMLGSCYLEKGDSDRAIHYFKEAAQIKGLTQEKFARLHYNLGLAYEASGMLTEAKKEFDIAFKKDRSFIEAKKKLEALGERL